MSTFRYKLSTSFKLKETNKEIPTVTEWQYYYCKLCNLALLQFIIVSFEVSVYDSVYSSYDQKIAKMEVGKYHTTYILAGSEIRWALFGFSFIEGL